MTEHQDKHPMGCETCIHNKTAANTILYRCELSPERISLNQSVLIDTLGCASYSGAAESSTKSKGYGIPDEPKASPRDFVFYRITGGIFEPELVTVGKADGAVRAYKRLAEMGYDPRRYDIMSIGKFSEFPDDYEN